MAGPPPGGGGAPPPGHDSFLASQQHNLQQQQGGAAGKTGAHELLGRLKPDHGLKPAHMGTFTGNIIPKPFGMPMFGGGINSRAAKIDMKKKGYAPPPGQAEHVNPQKAQHADPQQAKHVDPQQAKHVEPQQAKHVDPQKAVHTQAHFRHINAMGVGGHQMHPAFMGLDPFLGMKSAFMGMSLYAGRMSPHAVMNFMPVTGVFNAPDMNAGANRSFQAQASVVAAQVAAQAASAAAAAARGRS